MNPDNMTQVGAITIGLIVCGSIIITGLKRDDPERYIIVNILGVMGFLLVMGIALTAYLMYTGAFQ